MSDRCPVCGAEQADRTEAWLHLQEAHVAPRQARPTVQPGPTVQPATPSAPSGRAPAPPLPHRSASEAGPPSQPGAPSQPTRILDWSKTPVTGTILVITIGVWLLHVFLQTTTHLNTDLSLEGYAPAIAHGQWWRLVTPLVVHFGIIHIAFNMVWLYQLGTSLEQIMGKVAFALTYVATGIAGGVASDLAYHPAVASGGASGAIYGLGGVLVGAYATARYFDRRRTGPPAAGSLQFNGDAVRSLAIAFGLWLVIGNLVLRVDTAAHAGGAALGLVIGAALAAVRNRPPGAATQTM